MRAAAHRGASLIEVLVAMLLIALGILAMAAMQANATRIAKTSEFRAMGALLASDLADRMRANTAGVMYRATLTSPATNLYSFTTAYPSNGNVQVSDSGLTVCDGTTDCTAAQMAAFDMVRWRQTVARALPGGWVRVSAVDTTATGAGLSENGVDVWLMWVDVDNAPNTGDAQACPPNAVAPLPANAPASAQIPAPRCMYFRINL